jgi:hypothetical protein
MATESAPSKVKCSISQMDLGEDYPNILKIGLRHIALE